MNAEKEQPKEFNIETIFKDTRYIIPIYQRNYAWTSIEIEQLLEDIRNALNNSSKYYLGNLIVNRCGKNLYEVIDGQQRLTTLFLLLCFLNHNCFNKNSLTFQIRKKSNKTLQDIFTMSTDMQKIEYDDCYAEDIIKGYSFIKQYFDKFLDSIDDFKQKLSSISIIRIQVPKNIDLNKYFERMNTRGEQLELHEVLKAKIISAIKTDNNITEEDKKAQTIAAIIWDACAQMNKYVQMTFDTDKREKLFGQNWDTFICERFNDFYEIFADISLSTINRFSLQDKLKDINNSKYQRNYENNKIDENIIEDMRFESIIKFPHFLLQVNAVINDFQQNDKIELDDNQLIKSFKEIYSSKEKALDFIFNLLKYRYLFDKYIIKREYVGEYQIEGKWSLQRLEKRDNSPYYKATLNQANDETSKQNMQLCMLQSCLRITYTSPITMYWITKVLIKIGNNKNETEIISLLEDYCCEKLREPVFEPKKGFAIERIVFSYLDYILWRDHQEEFKTFQFQFRNSIEHFFPRNPISTDNKISNIDYFGNLALLTISANSKFSNMLPIHKVEQYPELISQSPKLMRMKKILDEKGREWNKDCIDKHGEEMWDILKTELENNNIHQQRR